MTAIAEVVLTGTGYPRPHPDRAGPGALLRCAGQLLQFDAGRATSMRLAALGVSCRDLDAVFLTHHHSDHLVGLADIALSRWIALDRATPDSALEIVAPAGPAARFAVTLLDPYADDIAARVAQTGRSTRPRVHCSAFEVAARPSRVWASGPIEVYAARVHHEPVEPAVAYRVDTPRGSVVISGDTRPCPELAELANGARVLVHEVVHGDLVRSTPSRGILDYHAGACELGSLLASIRVATLVLTHLIPAPDTPEAERALVDAVRHGGYGGEIVVGRDLTRVRLA